jgi:hypothetical protein
VVLGCFIWGPHDNRIPQTMLRPAFSFSFSLSSLSLSKGVLQFIWAASQAV